MCECFPTPSATSGSGLVWAECQRSKIRWRSGLADFIGSLFRLVKRRAGCFRWRPLDSNPADRPSRNCARKRVRSHRQVFRSTERGFFSLSMLMLVAERRMQTSARAALPRRAAQAVEKRPNLGHKEPLLHAKHVFFGIAALLVFDCKRPPDSATWWHSGIIFRGSSPTL